MGILGYDHLVCPIRLYCWVERVLHTSEICLDVGAWTEKLFLFYCVTLQGIKCQTRVPYDASVGRTVQKSWDILQRKKKERNAKNDAMEKSANRSPKMGWYDLNY